METVLEFIVEALTRIFSLALGLGVVGGLLYIMVQIHLTMWHRVASVYRREFDRDLHPSKLSGGVAITERGIRWGVASNRRQRVYPPIHLTVLPEGIGLQVMWPFRYGSKPVVLPFAEMELAATKWALWGWPVAIRMRGTPDIDIIVYRDTMEWAAEQSPTVAALMQRADPRLSEAATN